MASQVEIGSSSPFGCVIRDHNRHDPCSRESNARAAAAFQKNLKQLVRNHLHTCISVSSDEKTSSHDSLNMSSKHARNLDHWAACQAQEIVSIIEIKNEEAGLSRTSPTSKGSPPGSATSTESGNLGASSLVQIWEARSNRRPPKRSSSMNNNNQNSVPSTSRTSSISSCNETTCEEQLRDSSSTAEPSRESCTDEHATMEDSLVDLDLPTQREPSISQSISLDGERERVRIADIIRKLTSDAKDSEQHGNSVGDGLSRDRRQGSDSEQAEPKSLPQVLNTPIIRGRQAFNDLLSQMEQERKREIDLLMVRQAVSKFTHRGRIQSMLRLRFLHRGIASQDQQRPQSSPSTASADANRPQGSTIMHLRERFNAGVEQAITATTTSEVAHPRSTTKTVKTSNSSALNQQINDTAVQQARTAEQMGTIPVENSVTQTSKLHEDVHAESTAKTDITNIQTPYEHREDNQAESIASTDIAKIPTPCEFHDVQAESIRRTDNTNIQTPYEHHEDNQAESIASTDIANIPTPCESRDVQAESITRTDITNIQNPYEHREDNQEESIASTDIANILTPCEFHDAQAESIASTDIPWQGTNSEGDISHPQGTSEATPSWIGWDGNAMEDEVDDDQYYEGIDYDWFSEIARPRSYWEDQRQARYLEKLNTSSDDDELRKLLERRTVSNFLNSDMRVKIDQLMLSRSQQEVDQDEEVRECSQEQMGKLMLSYFKRHLHPASNEEEEQLAFDGGEAGEVEEEQESKQELGTPESHQYLEATDGFYQSLPKMHTLPAVRSWNYRHDHEISDHSENIPTIPPCPPMPSPGIKRDHRQSSPSRSHSPFEMGLVYDLKGHMEQLQHEMSELRRSIMTCMEMQVSLQKCINQEVHQGQVGGKHLLDTLTNNRICCICYERKVDSFLYRCGHMCTCLNCAHELQQNCGLCPICQAPILDVVKAQ